MTCVRHDPPTESLAPAALHTRAEIADRFNVITISGKNVGCGAARAARPHEF